MKKSIIVVALVVVAFFVQTGQALAVQPEEAPLIVEKVISAPRLTLIRTISPSISVSGTTATYGLSVTCDPTVKSVKAVFQLQQWRNGTWTNYGAAWETSASQFYLSASGTRSIVSGYSYRLKVSITASNGTTAGYATEYSR
ncbi:MAG: hypothetical protein FWC20_10165 [Oscillospiraceae bacterium]|nr:hypothetical protein [Oscillospiraceae bacterium]MCL2279752.1 hypothetical protein [Oscillospiraceae bacterium]